jgi:hypothetical protein
MDRSFEVRAPIGRVTGSPIEASAMGFLILALVDSGF